MNRDLNIIKKKYGEKMMHFCRDNFSTILETEGLLPKILLENFHESHSLYDDLVKNSKEDDFKNYIYKIYGDLVGPLNNYQVDHQIEETPEELMDKAGYVLRECLTEKDIQSYRKYYAEGEEICTFKGGRLNKCRVFFAVKKNVDEIKRENFNKPRRQDEYGTSVISIQFLKDGTNTLSIKNRYNHVVRDCDSTFSNDLDNIIAGLTDAFANTYGLEQQYKSNGFEMPEYIRANDRKYYKYNYEINNIYYCPDNIIIDNFEVKKFDKSKYLVLDYFILSLDKKNKGVTLYDENVKDSFPEIFNDIDKIDISNIENGKVIKITEKDGNVIEITIDKDNRIIGLNIGRVKEVGPYFLSDNRTLGVFKADCLEVINNDFLPDASMLMTLNIPLVRTIGDNSLISLLLLKMFDAPSLERVGRNCLRDVLSVVRINTPKLEEANDSFLKNCFDLTEINIPKLKRGGDSCLVYANKLKRFDAPSLKHVGNQFLENAYELEDFRAPCLRDTGNYFLLKAPNLLTFTASNLEKIGISSMCNCSNLLVFSAPKLTQVEDNFLQNSALRDEVLENVSKNKKRSTYEGLKEELLRGIDSFSPYDELNGYGGRGGK